jgi:rSAM/selenodomain-associated transferase 2
VALVSIVIPVLSDAAALARCLTSMPPDADVELIVVEGDADPAVEALVSSRGDARLIRTPAGRARQMNAGAAIARGRWLLFLHADSRLSANWREAIARADANGAAGGWFRLRLDSEAWQARMIERLVSLRVRLFRLPYGDQGYFVRRDLFATLGGYREIALMEDVEFVRRLVRAARVRPSSLPIVTSARRWQRDGWLRRSARNVVLVTLYFAGVSPARLAKWYCRQGSGVRGQGSGL